MKKRLWTLCLAVVTALCLCLGLTACGGDEEQPEATALSAPTNVVVNDKTLSWDAVEGATAGYTVKIGDDETTKVETGTSLDLTTVTAKLTEGPNTLAVKANGTDANPESAYSVSVTYNYSTAPAKTALAAPTGVQLDADGHTLKWNAVTGATAGYTVKIGTDETTKVTSGTSLDLTTVTAKLAEGANTLSVKANETAEKLASAYSATVTYTYTPVPEKTALAAPTGVKVEGTTLSWNAVDGATNGYTVKIRDNETTKVTDGTSLDLTTVTDKLVLGENAISVKANATEEKLESTYSALTGGYTYRTAYAAPANVKVEENILKWDAVEDATSYTVKIRSNETTTVQTTQLDLTSAAVSALLVSGANELSVKANANEAAYRSASPYSATVSYTFTPSAEKAVQDYKDLVAGIGTITADSHKADADEVKGELELADAAYTALQRDFPDSVNEVTTEHATHEQKQNDYDSVMTTAQGLATAYKNAVNDAKTVIDAKESLTTLTEKQTAANAAHEALSTLAKDLVEAGVDDNYALIATTVEAWTQEINAEKTKLTVAGLPDSFEDLEDSTAEDILDKIEAADPLNGYDALENYVKNDAGVIAAKKVIDDAKTAAETKLNTTVTALKGEVDTALKMEDTDTTKAKAKHGALTAAKEAMEALGTHAKSLYTTYSTDMNAIESAIADLTETVEDTVDYATYFANKSGKYVYVLIRTSYNKIGEAIELKDLPTVTATVSGTSSTTVEVTHSDDGSYIASIPVTKPAESGTAVEISYKWDTDKENTTVKVACDEKVFDYIDPGVSTDRVYTADGTLHRAAWNNADYYFDLYPEEALGFEAFQGDHDVTVKGAPILTRVPVTQVSTKALLKQYLAKQEMYGAQTFVIVVYKMWNGSEETEGVTYYSSVNSALVSDAITITVSEEDQYTKLDTSYLSAGIQEGGQFELYNPAYIGQINGQVNELSEVTGVTLATENPQMEVDMRKYFQARIRAINVDGDDITVLHEEVVEMVFIGTKLDDFISAWTVAYFRAHLDEYTTGEKGNPTFTKVKYQVCYEPKPKVEGEDNPLLKAFRASDWIDLSQSQGAEQPKLTEFEVTLEKADVVATNENQVRFTGNNYVVFLRHEGSIGNGWAIAEMKATYVEVKLTKEETTYTIYVLPEAGVDEITKETKLYLSTTTSQDETAQQCGTVGDGNITIGGFNDWMKKTVAKEDQTFDVTSNDEWSITTIVHVDSETSLWLFDGPESEATTSATRV